MRPIVDRCWTLLGEGRELLPTLTDEAQPVVRLFVEGGESVLQAIEDWHLETCIHRPRLTPGRKAFLVGRAWWSARAPRWLRIEGPTRGIPAGHGGAA